VTTGTSADFLSRLQRLIPPRWFNAKAPIRDAILGGLADALSWAYSLLVFAKTQTRIATAVGIFLDLIALDYFGTRISRRPSQPDTSFRTLILAELLRPRQTRAALTSAIQALTAAPVIIVEPNNPQDTACLNQTFVMGAGAPLGANLPFTVFITADVAATGGVPLIAGLNDPYGGLYPSTGGPGNWFALVSEATVIGDIVATDIYAAIEATRAAGVTCWVNVTVASSTASELDYTLVLDTSLLG